MGIPTVNTNLPDYMLTPPCGVYESAVKIKGSLYPALTNVGVCPTFGNMGCHGETYILDFNGDLYGEKIKIYLLRYLREEKTFDSPEELTREIEKNIKEVLLTGRERLWQRIGLK
jgi:riboflavin kinase/FMN adenylyltransferase